MVSLVYVKNKRELMNSLNQLFLQNFHLVFWNFSIFSVFFHKKWHQLCLFVPLWPNWPVMPTGETSGSSSFIRYGIIVPPVPKKNFWKKKHFCALSLIQADISQKCNFFDIQSVPLPKQLQLFRTKRSFLDSRAAISRPVLASSLVFAM